MRRVTDSVRLRVIETVNKKMPFIRGSGILVGLSGGSDSVTLTDVLSSLSKHFEISVYAVHVNHMIRGSEADRDENFCREFCQSKGIPLIVKKVNVPEYASKEKKSLELAARELRYRCFDEAAAETGCSFIATAHNADDLAETLLFNVIRGSSAAGIAAVPYVRGNIIRPLLRISKSDINAYAEEKKLSYVIDSTNSDTDYSRNYIRSEIVPLCKKMNPSFLDAVLRLTDDAKEENDFFDKTDSNDVCVIRRRIMRSHPEYGTNHDQLGRIAEAVSQGKSSSFSAYGGNVVKVNGGTVSDADDNDIVKHESPFGETVLHEGENVFLSGGIIICVGKSCKNFNSVYRNFTTKLSSSAIINNNLVVRSRLAGDNIKTGGMTRSLKKEFINKKIPAVKRSLVPVICCGGDIMFVPFVGTADKYKGDDTVISVLFKPDVI